MLFRSPAGQVPCGAHTPGRLRCRRPAAFAAEPQGFSLGPPCGRTSPDVLRSSAPHRRRHAGPPRPCQPPPWTSIPEQPRCLRQGCGHSRLTASAAPSTAAARGQSGAAGDGPARSLEVLARRRQDGGIAAAPRCEERRGPGPQGRAPQRRSSGCARSLARANRRTSAIWKGHSDRNEPKSAGPTRRTRPSKGLTRRLSMCEVRSSFLFLE